eukprot:1112608-Rhodomonas_salina.2
MPIICCGFVLLILVVARGIAEGWTSDVCAPRVRSVARNLLRFLNLRCTRQASLAGTSNGSTDNVFSWTRPASLLSLCAFFACVLQVANARGFGHSKTVSSLSRSAKLSLGVLLVGMLSLSVDAQTVTLTGGQPGWEAFVANATASSTIIFEAGTFVSLSGCNVNISADITLSGAGSGATFIDCGSSHRIFKILAGVTTTISGMSLTGGSTAEDGGCIEMKPGSSLTLSNMNITGCESTGGSGGAIAVGTDSTLTVQSTVFQGNKATSGYGGAILAAGDVTMDTATSTFTNNEATNG